MVGTVKIYAMVQQQNKSYQTLHILITTTPK